MQYRSVLTALPWIALLAAACAQPPEPPRPYDRPGEARRYFLQKRLPTGETALPVDRYLTALRRMERMPQHSTVRRAVLPSREEMARRGLSSAAGALEAWTPLGPGNVGGRTRVLLYDPRAPRTVWAGAASGGVWKSADGGVRWSPMGDRLANLAVNALAMDPRDSNVLYAGTGEGYFNIDAVRGAGIFKTADGGRTWTRLASTAGPNFWFVNDLAVSVRNPSRVYAATGTGVWRSLNGGISWSRALDSKARGGCLDLALRTDTPQDVLFASCGTFEQATVWRNLRADAGGRWMPVLRDSGMGRTTLAIAPSAQHVVYALAASHPPGPWQDGLHAMFRSTAGGAPGSWTARVRNTSPRKLDRLLLSNPVLGSLEACGFADEDYLFHQGWYDNVLAVDPKDPDRVWAGGIDLFRSDDGGRSWGLASYWWTRGRPAPSYAHADQHAIAFHPRYDGVKVRTMLVGNDGGIFRTLDARAATAKGERAPCDPARSKLVWQSLNRGYAVTQFYHGAPYPDGSSYLGGTQDNGTVRGTDAGGPDRWEEILGGDGGYVAVDPTDPDVVYAEGPYLSFAKSTDGGKTFAPAIQGVQDAAFTFPFIAPFVMDPSDPRRLWLGGPALYRTTDGAGLWTRASTTVAGRYRRYVSAIAVAPADPDRVLAGTWEGWIHHSTAALSARPGDSWPANRPREGFVSSLAFDPADPDVAYATYSTFGGAHVWKTADGGATWKDLDGTGAGRLPDVPAHSLVVDPADPARLYLGTDVGVFASLDGGETWMVENTGFANVVTESLSLLDRRDGSRALFAFTHGRGAWRVGIE